VLFGVVRSEIDAISCHGLSHPHGWGDGMMAFLKTCGGGLATREAHLSLRYRGLGAVNFGLKSGDTEQRLPGLLLWKSLTLTGHRHGSKKVQKGREMSSIIMTSHTVVWCLLSGL